MNLPGRPDGNWSWRLAEGELLPEHADRLRELAELYGRVPVVDPSGPPPSGEKEGTHE
jgi:4-alpha-glucanotransferase